jgi:hypothetical protein
MMLDKVHDRVAATGTTRAFQWVLYYDVESKRKNCHIITFLDSLFPKTGKCEMLPLETIAIRRYINPPFRFPGGEVFLEETPGDRSYSKKENKEKQKVNRSIKIVRNLHQGGKFANLINKMKKNACLF